MSPRGVQLTDKIAVVQRCARNRCTGKPYRLKHGIRRQHAGAPYRDDDILEQGLLDSGGYLYAAAHRGNFAVEPSVSRCARN